MFLNLGIKIDYLHMRIARYSHMQIINLHINYKEVEFCKISINPDFYSRKTKMELKDLLRDL